MKNEVVWLRWAHHVQITKATKVRGPSSALVFSHLAWVPHLPGPPRQAPRAGTFHPSRVAGARTRRRYRRSTPALLPGAPPFSVQARARRPSGAVSARPGHEDPRPSAPAILRAGVCGGRGVSQTATHTYLQSHGWSKHVALETATAGASARSLCSSESADDNALYVRRFAAGRDPHSLFPFYELSRSAENPFTHAHPL